MPPIAVKAVIFDYGCVLSLPQMAEEREQLLRLCQLEEAHFEAQYWKYRPQYDGGWDASTYWQHVLDIKNPLAKDLLEALQTHDHRGWMQIDQVMLDWFHTLKHGGWKLGMISNMTSPMLAQMRREFEWLKLLDHGTFSCELGILKPEPEIYRHSLKGLDLKAEEVLFLDDRPENIEAAAALGMHTIWVASVKHCAQELPRFALPALETT